MSADTKIAKVTSHLVRLPIGGSYQVGLHLEPRTQFATLLLTIETVDGLTGNGYISINSTKLTVALGQMAAEMETILVGRDALDRNGATSALQRGLRELLGTEGLVRMLLGTVDIALWDIFGKVADLSVARLLGGAGDPVTVYASHGLYAGESDEDLPGHAAQLVEQGFQGMKVRVGQRTPAHDSDRLHRVRDAVGPDPKIMIDGLWSMTVSEAVALAKKIEDVGITWFEDPMPEGQVRNLRRLRDSTTIPIASGERVSRIDDFQRLLEVDAIDVAILDLHHVGGVSAWHLCAQLADQCNVKVAGHSAPELNCHMVSASPNGYITEYFPWWNPLYLNPPEAEGSKLAVPELPGWGVSIDWDAIGRMKLDPG